MMRIFPGLAPVLALCGLLFLCSCAAPRRGSFTVVQSPLALARELPRDVAMNWNAGQGEDLLVTLKVGNGREVPFVLDTGASATAFDKSLEPLLRKRVGTGTIYVFGVKHEADSYRSPPLYVGDTPLMMTGPYVAAVDLSHLATKSAQPVMGILGMDVLEHYCLQLDFRAHKIRFLNPQHAQTNRWGKPFPLIDLGDGCYYISENLTGSKSPGSLVDTGCADDGWLVPKLFAQWTNEPPITMRGQVFPHYGVLDGETYPQVYLRELDQKLFLSGDMHLTLNGIGLRFLSRNLVTLDFPDKTLFLKRVGAGIVTSRHMADLAWRQGASAASFLRRLQRKGQLPGWSKEDSFPIGDIRYVFQYPDVVTFNNFEKGYDLSHYHYRVVRISKNGPWKLIKAWRTDANGQVIEEYPVP